MDIFTLLLTAVDHVIVENLLYVNHRLSIQIFTLGERLRICERSMY